MDRDNSKIKPYIVEIATPYFSNTFWLLRYPHWDPRGEPYPSPTKMLASYLSNTAIPLGLNGGRRIHSIEELINETTCNESILCSDTIQCQGTHVDSPATKFLFRNTLVFVGLKPYENPNTKGFKMCPGNRSFRFRNADQFAHHAIFLGESADVESASKEVIEVFGSLYKSHEKHQFPTELGYICDSSEDFFSKQTKLKFAHNAWGELIEKEHSIP